MLQWTKAQWEAFARHLITTASATIATLVAVNLVKAEDATAIVSSATQLITAITGLAAIVVPIVAGYYASKSASPERQAAQTVANLQSGTPLNGEKTKLIEAVAEQPEVRKVVMQDPAVADNILSQKVTAA